MPEILIEGRGLAGHNLANRLADNGSDVLLSGKEYKVPRSWFVLTDRLPTQTQEKIRSGEIPSNTLDACRFVIIDPKTNEVKDDFTSKSHGQFNDFACVVIDDRVTKAIFRDSALSHSSVSVNRSSVRRVSERGAGYEVLFENGEKESFEKVVDASGSSSKLLRSLEDSPLADNPIVYWIYGWRVRGKFDKNTMVFPLKDKSTGRMSWISPWSDEVADILAADYCRVSDWKKTLESGYFQETYERLREMCVELGVCQVTEELERIYGRTRLVPIKQGIGSNGVFAVGDAAGQSCPNMAEGIPPALLNSDFLAVQLNQDPSYTGQQYYHDWRHGRQKIEPYELSASFLATRFFRNKAGGNASLYRTIANDSDMVKMMRLLRERKPSVGDVPMLTRAFIHDPAILPRIVSIMLKSKLVFRLPGYQSLLYGGGIPQSVTEFQEQEA